MPTSRDGYRISAQSLEELLTVINFVLSGVSDRLDTIEGNRGDGFETNESMTVNGSLYVYDSQGNLIHSFGP